MSQRRIFIAVPTYSGEVNGHAMLSLMRAVEEGRRNGWHVEVAMRPLDSLLARCRNVLVDNFLKSGADDLLFWDADVAAVPGAFVRLMMHDVDFVGGAYPARSDPEHYIFRQLPGPLSADPKTGLIEVEGVGTGFLRITRAAIDRMIAHHADLWIVDRVAGRLAWLFDFELRDHEYWSEDFVFCRRWREADGKVWIDAELPFHHIGQKKFSGHCGDFLRRQASAAVGPEELAEDQRELQAAECAALGRLNVP